MKIFFTGGGTLGSVTPLLALYEALHPKEAYWVGTYRGIERTFIASASIRFFPILAGKFRRYYDWRNLLAPFAVAIGCVQSFFLLIRFRPTYVVGAGGYVAVPVTWAAWILRIPCYAIQLDVLPGLANRLIAPFVRTMFVAFDASADFFSQRKVVVSGSLVRQSIFSGKRHTKRETLLVLGGGTGALSLNLIVAKALPYLEKICDVVHITGKGKETTIASSSYHVHPFVTDAIASLYASADLVLTRAGMGALSELAALAKAAIVVPLPESAQEENAALLSRQNAAVVIAQDTLTPEKLVATVTTLFRDAMRRRLLGETLHRVIPTDGVKKIAACIMQSA